MTPPGLAFLAVSPRAWRQIESIARPAFYFDLLAYRKAAERPKHLTRPPSRLSKPWPKACGRSAARAWRPFGPARAAFAGHAGRHCRVGLEARRQAAGGRRFGRLSAGRHRWQEVPGAAGRAVWDQIGRRQGPLKGRIFRIAQMGLVDEVDILGCLAAIELCAAGDGEKRGFGLGRGRGREGIKRAWKFAALQELNSENLVGAPVSCSVLAN